MKSVKSQFAPVLQDLLKTLRVNFVEPEGILMEPTCYGFYDFIQDCIVVNPEHINPIFGDINTVLMHELIHWTGHESRLARPASLIKSQAELNLVMFHNEEAVAELGMAHLATSLGWDSETINEYARLYLNGYYLANYIEADKEAIKAANYILEKMSLTKAA
jgi:antirestriction protein ArdC